LKAAENGKRNDLVEVVENIKSGATLREIYEASPTTYMRNYRAIGHVRQMTYEPPAFRDNLVVRLYIMLVLMKIAGQSPLVKGFGLTGTTVKRRLLLMSSGVSIPFLIFFKLPTRIKFRSKPRVVILGLFLNW
jgi:hypothetical protein